MNLLQVVVKEENNNNNNAGPNVDGKAKEEYNNNNYAGPNVDGKAKEEYNNNNNNNGVDDDDEYVCSYGGFGVRKRRRRYQEYCDLEWHISRKHPKCVLIEYHQSRDLELLPTKWAQTLHGWNCFVEVTFRRHGHEGIVTFGSAECKKGAEYEACDKVIKELRRRYLNS